MFRSMFKEQNASPEEFAQKGKEHLGIEEEQQDANEMPDSIFAY